MADIVETKITRVAPDATRSTRSLSGMEDCYYELRAGLSRKALVMVMPDRKYPGMWRLLWPEGSESDMTNLARAKDAAADICQRTAPGKDRLRFQWKKMESSVLSEAAE